MRSDSQLPEPVSASSSVLAKVEISAKLFRREPLRRWRLGDCQT
jgi:hypothetical protein